MNESIEAYIKILREKAKEYAASDRQNDPGCIRVKDEEDQ